LSWIFSDEESSYSDHAIDATLTNKASVPENFWSEVAHGLLSAERRNRFDEAATSASLWEIMQFSLEVIPADMHMTISLARRFRLTCYDAAYLTLAVQTASPLATIDQNLRKAAEALKLYWSPAQSKRPKRR